MLLVAQFVAFEAKKALATEEEGCLTLRSYFVSLEVPLGADPYIPYSPALLSEKLLPILAGEAQSVASVQNLNEVKAIFRPLHALLLSRSK